MSKEQSFAIEMEKEADGRWLAEVVELPGVMAYGKTREQAQARVEALAFRVLAEKLEEDIEEKPVSFTSVAFSRV